MRWRNHSCLAGPHIRPHNGKRAKAEATLLGAVRGRVVAREKRPQLGVIEHVEQRREGGARLLLISRLEQQIVVVLLRL